MDLKKIIARLRDEVEIFQGRVSGAASYEKLLDRTSAKLPCACVVPDDDSVSDTSSGASVYHTISESFMVVVALPASDDLRGEAPAVSVYTVRDVLLFALVGGNMSHKHGPVTYQGFEILSVDAFSMIASFSFSCDLCFSAASFDFKDVSSLPLADFLSTEISAGDMTSVVTL